MKSEVNDGGPAFPVIETVSGAQTPSGKPEICSVGGMSLRDWFAGQVLPTVVAHIPENTNEMNVDTVAAIVAYRIADAMLKAREG